MKWKFTDSTNAVVFRTLKDGRMESMLVTTPEIQAWIAKGNVPDPADVPPTPTVDQERERARAAMNPLRDTFLNRLAGIAVFTPDEDVKSECAALRIALLDITKDQAFLVAETYQDMENALMSRYRIIASSASIVVRNVFKELEA